MAPPAKRKCTSSHRILATSLEPEAFKPFGQVVQNPASHGGLPKLDTTEANQGTATKWLNVTDLRSFYELARSGKAAKPVMNMFVCRPRELEGNAFNVKILERHPFTPQTFIPLGVSASDPATRYLVIVAPTLPTTTRGPNDLLEKPYPAESPRKHTKTLKERLLGARPNPFTNDHVPTTTPPTSAMTSERKPKGPGGPDLANLQAFIVRGNQAVTYGPGTWHAPMVVLGDKDVPFVVVQYANGVGLEDCQEAGIGAIDGGEGVVVDVGQAERGEDAKASGAGIMRAKL